MDTARQHWEILRRVPDELARKVREFMVIGDAGEGVLLATDSGDGYWMGEMKFGWFGMGQSKQAMEPTRLDVPKLASMAQGHGHILLLTESGQIYAMGMNEQGQLGLGTVDRVDNFSPRLIPSSHKFTLVRCGFGHSLALTSDGKVCAWGRNDFDQVGLPSSTAFLPSPRKISELDRHRVVEVECGCFNSLALTDQGEVYGWGSNDFGQLGNQSTPFLHIPTQITTLTRIPTPSPVQSIAAGYSHTLLLTRTGEVYACGWNQFGQLGHPTSNKISASLVKVSGLPPISQIASHFKSSLSIAMSADQRFFAWGQLSNTTTTIPLQLPSNYSTLDSILSFHSTPHNTPCSVRVEGSQMST